MSLQEQLITFETAKLAKEKGCIIKSDRSYNSIGNLESHRSINYYAPTQSLLQKFIREKRGVHIEIHRNASGWYWSMCLSDGGTDLGWSDHRGPNLGGVWDKFEEALEDAIFVQLSYDIPKNTKVIKHWGNYVDFAIKSINK